MSENESLFKKVVFVLKDFFNPKEWVATLRSIPSLVLTLCVIANTMMNILANKSIINLPYLVQDAGLLFSWVGFLAGDLVVRGFGTKNSLRVSITTLVVSLLISCLLLAVSYIPGEWSPIYNYDESYSEVINESINSIIGNQWYVILGSALASLCGLIINNVTQGTLLKVIIKKHGDHYPGYLIAGGLSTIIGQFIDNLIFALVISVNFFGWTYKQVLMCSLMGALVELVCEMVFTPITYKISQNWKKNGIGIEWIK